jgi:Skp family chaperone for outer membrane proteins
MPKDQALEDIEKEIQKLKDEQARVNDYLAELEAKSKAKIAELEVLERKKQQEDKLKLEKDMKDIFSELLRHNWQLIPAFLNESFEYLKNVAAEYDRLKSKETELRDNINTSLKNPALKHIDLQRLQEENRMVIGGRVELILELKRLLQLIDSKKASWTQDPNNVLRFFDVSREIKS